MHRRTGDWLAGAAHHTWGLGPPEADNCPRSQAQLPKPERPPILEDPARMSRRPRCTLRAHAALAHLGGTDPSSVVDGSVHSPMTTLGTPAQRYPGRVWETGKGKSAHGRATPEVRAGGRCGSSGGPLRPATPRPLCLYLLRVEPATWGSGMGGRLHFVSSSSPYLMHTGCFPTVLGFSGITCFLPQSPPTQSRLPALTGPLHPATVSLSRPAQFSLCRAVADVLSSTPTLAPSPNPPVAPHCS